MHENQIIYNYLKNLRFVKDYGDEMETNLEMIAAMATRLQYQMFKQNNIMFRYGDMRNNFYIVLRGGVSIIFPHNYRVKMSVSEYVKYLVNLKIHKEKEIYFNCLKENANIFNLNDKDVDFIIDKIFHRMKEIEGKSNNILSIKGFRIDMNIFNNLNIDNLLDDEALISVEEYCSRVKPVWDEKGQNEKSLVSVYEMKQVVTLQEGEKFGDYSKALQIQKRTATVITMVDSHFAILEKNDYDEIMKELFRKMRINNSQWLQSYFIFEDIDDGLFLKKYFNYFIKCKSIMNTKIVEKGENADYLYFMKQGTYEIVIDCNLLELVKLLDNYGGINNLNEEYERMLSDKNFKKYMTKPRVNKMTITSEKSIIGLDDTVINNKYSFSLRCTKEGDYFKIEKKNFINIIENELAIKKKVEIFIYKKKEIYLDRLKQIIRTLLEKFDYKEEQDEENRMNQRYYDFLSQRQYLKQYPNSKFSFFNDPNMTVKIPPQLSKYDDDGSLRKLRSDRIERQMKNPTEFRNTSTNGLISVLKNDTVISSISPINVSPTRKRTREENFYNLPSIRTEYNKSHLLSLNSIEDLTTVVSMKIGSNSDKKVVIDGMLSSFLGSNSCKKKKSNVNVIDCLAYDRMDTIYTQYSKQQNEEKKVFLTEENKPSRIEKVIFLPKHTIKKFYSIQSRIKHKNGKGK